MSSSSIARAALVSAGLVAALSGVAAQSCDAGGPYVVDCIKGQARVALTAADCADDFYYEWIVDGTPLVTDQGLSNPIVSLDETSLDCTSGPLPVTLNLKDSAGGTVTESCQTTISVQDTQPPSLVGVTWPDGSTLPVLCEDLPAQPFITASDNCHDTITADFKQIDLGGTSADDYTIVWKWSAQDHCGLTASTTRTLSVSDIEAPQFTGIPADVTVECDAVPENCEVAVDDNCDDTVTAAYVQTKFGGANTCQYHLERKWSSTDRTGNANSVDQNVYVVDTLAPTLVGVPNDVTVECDEIPQAVDVRAVDNCQAETTVSPVTTGDDGDHCSNEIVYTYTADDGCSNVATAAYTVFVRDSDAPVLVGVPADITVETDDVPEPCTTVVGVDNCELNPNVDGPNTRYLSTHANCPLRDYVEERTWRVQDACTGQWTEEHQTVTVQDNTPPYLSGLPCTGNDPEQIANEATYCSSEITVDCDSVPEYDVQAFEDPALTQLIGAVVVNEVDSRGGDDSVQTYTLTRTWTSSDQCGNSVTFVQTVHVEDNSAPYFLYEPSDQTIECDCDIVPARVLAEDNCCIPNPVPTEQDYEVLTGCEDEFYRVYTWTVDDCSLNNGGGAFSATTSQTIHVEDSTNPVFTSPPADSTFACDDVQADYHDQLSADAADDNPATDNCDLDVDVTRASGSHVGACNHDYYFVETFTASDNCGNTATDEQTITVYDDSAPSFDAPPADATVDCTAAAPGSLATTDNCDVAQTVPVSSSDAPGGCPERYTQTNTWTVTDDCGNTNSHTQIVTVVDDSSATLDSTPAHASAEACAVPPQGTVTASDNCGPVSVSESDSTIAGAHSEDYSQLYTWTTADNCQANPTTYTQTITVQDTTDPTMTFTPALTTVRTFLCDEAVPTYTYTTDDCDPNPDVSSNESPPFVECGGTFSFTKTWTVTDNSGNSQTYSQSFLSIDVTPPHFVTAPYHVQTNPNPTTVAPEDLPQDVTVECDNVPPQASLLVHDNCCEGAVCHSVTQVPSPTPVIHDPAVTSYTYDLERDWNCKDGCNNPLTWDQTVTVQDTTDPDFNWDNGLPADDTIECSGPGSMPGAETFSATDNCAHVTDVWQTVVPSSDYTSCGPKSHAYAKTFAYEIKDLDGNSDTHTYTVTVEDTTPPVWDTVPLDVTFRCDEVIVFDAASASDTCQLVSGTEDLPRVDTQGPVDANGDDDTGYAIYRTWTASDKCGNTQGADQTITIHHPTPPTITCPADVTVDCNDDTGTANTGVATFTDVCDNFLQITDSDVVTEGSGAVPHDPNVRTIARTFSVTNTGSLSDSCTQTITVTDTVNPSFTFTPTDELACYNLRHNGGDGTGLIEFGAQPIETYFDSPTYDDDCSLTPDVSISTDTVYCGDVNWPLQDCGCDQDQYAIRTWTITDEAGNTATESQTITLCDTTSPTADLTPHEWTIDACLDLPDTTLTSLPVDDHAGPPPLFQDPAPTFVPDPAGTFTGDFGLLDGVSCLSYYEVYQYKWTDDCGNSDTGLRTVNAWDVNPPTWDSQVPDKTVECHLHYDNVPVPSCQNQEDCVVAPTASDDCGFAPTNEGVPVTTGMADGTPNTWQTVYTYSAHDGCDSRSPITQTVTVTVDDTVNPTVTNPADDTQTIDYNQWQALTANPPPCLGADSCGLDSMIPGDDWIPGTCFHEGTQIYTCQAKDGANNLSPVRTLTFNVVDDIAPTAIPPTPLLLERTDFPDNIPDIDLIAPVPSDNVATLAQISLDTNQFWCELNVGTGQYDEVAYDAETGEGLLCQEWCYEDPCENQNCYIRVITIEDNTDPRGYTPPPSSVTECGDAIPDAQAQADALTLEWQTEHANDPQEADLEFTVVVTLVPNQAYYDWTQHPLWLDGFLASEFISVTEFTFTITDESDNSVSFSTYHFLVDTTPPLWDDQGTCGALPEAPYLDNSGECQDIWHAGNADADTADFPNYCEACEATEWEQSDVAYDYDPGYDVFTRITTWRVTDGVGHVLEHVQTYTSVDTIAPVVSTTSPLTQDIECPNPLPGRGWSCVDACDPAPNCGPEIPTVVLDRACDNPTSPDLGDDREVHTFEYYATDRSGNSFVDAGPNPLNIKTWTVKDTVSPSIDSLPPGGSFDCRTPPVRATEFLAFTASDACASGPNDLYLSDTWDNQQALAPAAGHTSYSIIADYVVNDGCGDVSSQSVTWTTDDSVPCSIVDAGTGNALSSTASYDCADDYATVPLVTVNDNCVDGLTTTYNGVYDDSGCQDFTFIRRWDSADYQSNTCFFEQTVTVTDSTPPTIDTHPLDGDYSADCVAPTYTVGDATCSDDCGSCTVDSAVSSILSGTEASDNYVKVWTFTATDECGASVTADTTVTVNDQTNPTISCPNDVTYNCEDTPDLTAQATATDNCDGDVSINRGAENALASCDGEDLFTVTWTATDNNGNTDTCEQTVSSIDDDAPTITNGPTDLIGDNSVDCGDGPDPAPGTVAATDACDTGVNSAALTFDANIVTIDEWRYTVRREWTATDDCGNTSTHEQTIEVNDNTPPTYDSCPAAATYECDAVPPQGDLSYSDDCGPASSVFDEEVVATGTCDGDYTLRRTWTLTDSAGLTDTCEQLVTVEDTTNPVFDSTPADYSIDCNPDPQETIGAADACSDPVTVTKEASIVIGDPNTHDYDIVYVWNAQDDCGNTEVHQQTVQVVDDEAPESVAGVTRSAGNYPEFQIACDSVWPQCTRPWEDNCVTPGEITVAGPLGGERIDRSQYSAEADCHSEYKWARTYTGTDLAGNVGYFYQTIHVVDNDPPTFDVATTPPVSETVDCASEVPTYTPTASDSCCTADDIANGIPCAPVVAQTVDDTVDSCIDDGFITREWTATDDCGLVTTIANTVHVEDNTPPTVVESYSASTTTEYPDFGPVPVAGTHVTCTDDCDNPTPSVTSSDDNSPLPDCPQNFNRIWDFGCTDSCGNSDTEYFTVRVRDTTPPVFSGLPAAASQHECDNIPDAPSVTFTDNGAVGVFSSTPTEVSTQTDDDSYTIYRTWSETDDCGNNAEHTHTLTIVDTTEPTLSDYPADIDCVSIEDVCDHFYDITATDNCDPDVEVTYSETITESGDCTTLLTDYTWTRTWQAVDRTGNVETHTQTIEVCDNTPPVPVGVPGPETYNCLEAFPDADKVGVSGYDNNGHTVVTSVVDTRIGDGSNRADIQRVWTFTDTCGNEQTAQQIISFQDTEGPVLYNTPEEEVTVECPDVPDHSGCDVTWYDSCLATSGSVGAPSGGEIAAVGNDVATYQWTWSATDGITSTDFVHTVHVVDTTAPSFSRGVEDITVECDCTEVAFPTVEAQDACDAAPVLTITHDGVVGSPADTTNTVGEWVQTWSAVDASGLSSEISRTITRVDTTQPTFDHYPVDATVQCDEIPDADAGPSLYAYDACDSTIDDALVSPTETEYDDSPCDGQIVRHWTVSDGETLPVDHYQTITIVDDTDPFIESTADQCVYPVNNRYYTVGVDDILDHVSDNCGGVVTVSVFACNTTTTAGPWDANCALNGDDLEIAAVQTDVYTVYVDVTDQCGNVASTTVDYHVIDSTTDPLYDPLECCSPEGEAVN